MYSCLVFSDQAHVTCAISLLTTEAMKVNNYLQRSVKVMRWVRTLFHEHDHLELHERGLRRMWSVNWTERCFCINFIHLIASACMIRAVQVTFNHFHLVLHENIKSEYVIQVQLFWRMFWEHFKSSCFHGPVDFRPRYIVFTCWCFSCCTVWNRQKTDVIFAFVVQAYLQNAFF